MVWAGYEDVNTEGSEGCTEVRREGGSQSGGREAEGDRGGWGVSGGGVCCSLHIVGLDRGPVDGPFMLIGNVAEFAIESHMRLAYAKPWIVGCGRFGFHVAGKKFGLLDDNDKETLLACSLDSVRKHIEWRGMHAAPFALTHSASEIADGVMGALYEPDTEGDVYCGLDSETFKRVIYDRHLQIAPDGDEAFDDGSHVLLFDVPDGVRLIGFRSLETYRHDPASLAEHRMSSEAYYGVLQAWVDAFEAEWEAAPKVGGDEYMDP